MLQISRSEEGTFLEATAANVAESNLTEKPRSGAVFSEQRLGNDHQIVLEAE
jgi:hypothetical protein